MVKTSAQQYKFDTDEEAIPSTNERRGTEGRVAMGSLNGEDAGSNVRDTVSEGVGPGSLPGFVRRNKGQFEQTEGRM